MNSPEIFESYHIRDTSAYILNHGFKRVALQFPDHLLNVSVMITSTLRSELNLKTRTCDSVQLYVLADTTFGSCCGDEVAAAHVNAECIIHYGHTCHSRMSNLPIWYVYGRSSIDIEDCIQKLSDHLPEWKRSVLVLYDLDYVHAIPSIKEQFWKEETKVHVGNAQIFFATALDRGIEPVKSAANLQGAMVSDPKQQHVDSNGRVQECHSRLDACHNLGGLCWSLPQGCKMDSVILYWIGQEGPALTNFMLVYNSTIVVRYDPDMKTVHMDSASNSKILKRRYYLVERAKDANIVGIVVGTLGVAGYRETVNGIKKLVKEAGKKSYILAIGKPSAPKLANFPECDIFVLVACTHMALLDSKDFMTPLITPYEAVLAWKRGRQWTGSYSLDFSSVLESCKDEDKKESQEEPTEARFSFLRGAYVEDSLPMESGHAENKSRALVIQERTGLVARDVMSGMEYLASRSYHGLEVDNTRSSIEQFVIGRHGRASGYKDETA